MTKHFIIISILLFSLSLSACNKDEISTETSSVLPTQETEVIEETSTQITTSGPATAENLLVKLQSRGKKKGKMFQLLQRHYHKLQK